MPIYPNVPDVAGVPPLLRNPLASATDIIALALTDIADQPGIQEQQWGLFQGGLPVIVADTITAFDYRQEWNDLNYPIEEGAFGTYNKVQIPFQVVLRFSRGGSQQNRQDLLDSIDAIAGDLQLYDVNTPEKQYLNVNVIRQELRRTALNGVGLLQVDVHVVEIRDIATVAFSSTQSPSGAGAQGNGLTQATAPTASDNLPAISPSSGSGPLPTLPNTNNIDLPSWWQ